MKRLNNLFESIISIENLTLADSKARKGKVFSKGILNHDKNKKQNILNIHLELKNKTFKTSEYSSFKIIKPKERTIFSLPYKDRIVHHAIMNILEPIWLKIFTTNSYSCIKGKGRNRN